MKVFEADPGESGQDLQFLTRPKHLKKKGAKAPQLATNQSLDGSMKLNMATSVWKKPSRIQSKI